MAVNQQARGAGDTLVTSLWVFLSLAGVAAGMTLLFLGMRSVLEIGGACADGGPYVSAQPCPQGVAVATFGGIWGGIACLGLYAWGALRRGVPTMLWLAWPALFLSLGWNFLEFGLHPPGDSGLAWGWLVCAVVFGLMGGVPLALALPLTVRSFFRPAAGEKAVANGPSQPAARPTEPAHASWPEAASAQALPPQPARAVAAPGMDDARRRAVGRLLRNLAAIQAAPAAGESRDGPGGTGVVEGLERLARLHREGALSDGEFAAAKARLLEEAR